MTESIIAPKNPPAPADTTATVGHCMAHANSATNVAPPAAASVPCMVTPPDVPVGTGWKPMIERASARANAPSSVAHVSALDVANAPAPMAIHRSLGENL